MKLILAALFGLIPLMAQASTSIIMAGQGGIPVSATLEIPAEYVGVSVNIRSGATNAMERLEDVARTREKLIDALKKKEHLEIQWVKSTFSADEGSSFSVSSSYRSESNSQLFILGKINESSADSVAREIISVLSTVKVEGDAGISTGNSSLGIVNPEQYRTRLLGLIKEQLEQLKTSLGSVAEAEVSGLEAPVTVIQKNDREVALFLPYRIKVLRK